MEKFSIGILSWHSTDVLINTLKSYHDNGLLYLCDDVTIFFQESDDPEGGDIKIADHFGINYIKSKENIGIGQAFIQLAKNAKHDNIFLLEHDWELIEPLGVVEQRLTSGIWLLEAGYDCIRYRHRVNPGYPHFSVNNYKTYEKAMAYVDPEIKAPYPHLLDTVHFEQFPDIRYKGKIGQQIIGEDIYYVAPSKYANFTNNPCLYKKDFYLKFVKPYVGKGIDLEGKISYDWNRANFNVAHGEGLFMHRDERKFPSK